jgi:hypothetical protein
MAFPTVDINLIDTGSGGQATGFDHYSGMIFYGTAPTVTGKWTQYPGPPVIKVQQMFSAQDATDAGIVPFSDNTAATGTYVISAKGNTGDIIKIDVVVPLVNGTTTTVNLCTYTEVAGDSTIALLGASIAAAINANTVTTGYSASFTTATLTLTAPKSTGISLNTGTPIVVTITGTIAGTITQFNSGTASQHSIWKYQISEYFRIHSEGVLFVGILASSSSFNEISVLQYASKSKLRQVLVYDTDTTRASAANIIATALSVNTACNVSVKTAPILAVYSPNIKNVTDLSTYPDQNLNTASRVQIVISQDGDAAGALLYVQNGQSVGNGGAKLASISKSRVSASDAQPISSFNMSDGTEK